MKFVKKSWLPWLILAFLFFIGATYRAHYFPDIIVKGPWLDIRAYSSINAAISDIGSTPKTIYVINNESLTGALTSPSTAHLHFLMGGKITLGDYNLTINGPMSGPISQRFDDSGVGSVSFGGEYIDEVYVEWWGIDGVADQTEINKAIVAAADIPVKLLTKTYTLSGYIDMLDGASLVGSGMGATILSNGGMGVAIRYNGSGGATFTQTLLSDLKISDAGSGTDGIYLNYTCVDNVIQRVWITGAGQYGINFNSNSYLTTIKDCHIESSTSHGIYIQDEESHVIISRTRINTNDVGIYITDNTNTVASTKILACNIESNTGGGVYIHKTAANTTSINAPNISKCHFEGNSNYDVKIDSTQSYPNYPGGVLVHGNYFLASDANHNMIQSDHSVELMVWNNVFNTGAVASIDAIQLSANTKLAHLGPNKLIGSGTYLNANASATFSQLGEGVGGFLRVETDSSIGKAAAYFIQVDNDQPGIHIKHDAGAATGPLIKVEGDSAGDTSVNISTMQGGGIAVDGPLPFGGAQNGWNYTGMIRINVNGTDRWVPYYTEDTS